MKKIFILLIAMCSVVMASAQTARKKTTNNGLPPRHVVETLNNVIKQFGNDSTQVYSVNKNPNTNQVESSVRVVSFMVPIIWAGNDINPAFSSADISNAFIQDEPLSYQILHLTPGSNENFSLKTLLENGSQTANFRVRTNRNQEMWLMCTKNPTNPQLRDAYAIVWQRDGDARVYGKVFMITSLRPDLFERNMESSANTFRIDGRVGHDINDSLYVFFMADSYEELKQLRTMVNTYDELTQTSDSRIAYMPVLHDRSFGISVQIDKRKCGAIRTVMPDGSLCQLWTNLDMVPGESYRITTHNGYFDEDLDFERRVGRYSGKSMIVGHDNDDVEYWNAHDTLAVDTVFIADIAGAYDDPYADVGACDDPYADGFPANAPHEVSMSKRVSMEQIHKFENLGETISKYIEQINENYKGLERSLRPEMMGAFNSMSGESWYKASEFVYNDIDMDNKLLDASVTQFCKLAPKMQLQGDPVQQLVGAYNYLSDFYATQHKHYDMLYKKFGFWSKPALKCQKTITRLTEKYVKLLKKAMRENK